MATAVRERTRGLAEFARLLVAAWHEEIESEPVPEFRWGCSDCLDKVKCAVLGCPR